jgi:hypothetical protein
VEGGDTGLGRDAHGPPMRQPSHHSYRADGPYPPDEPPFAAYEEEDETARAAGPVGVDDYGQLLRRPGEMPPRQPRHQRPREPGNPPVRPPGQFTPNLSPTLSQPYSGPPGAGR